MLRSVSLLFGALCAFVVTSDASAQAAWTHQSSEANQVTLEAYRPGEPSAGYAFSQRSSFYYLSGRLSLTDRLQATAELPFGYGRVRHMPSFGQNEFPRPASGLGLGNPYLGVAWTATEHLDVEVGGRLPVAGYKAGTFIGGLNATTRATAFHRDIAPVQAIVRSTHALGRGFSLVLHGGPELVVRTDRGLPHEWAVQYGVQGWYETRYFALGAGFHGREEAGWSDQEVNATLVGKIGRVRPGFVVRHHRSGDALDTGFTVVGVSLGLTLPAFR